MVMEQEGHETPAEFIIFVKVIALYLYLYVYLYFYFYLLETRK